MLQARGPCSPERAKTMTRSHDDGRAMMKDHDDGRSGDADEGGGRGGAGPSNPCDPEKGGQFRASLPVPR